MGLIGFFLGLLVQPGVLTTLGLLLAFGIGVIRPWRWLYQQQGAGPVVTPAQVVPLDEELIRDIAREVVVEQSVLEQRFVGLGKVLEWVRKNVFTFRTLYWTVNLVVMAFSAENGGHLFGMYESVGVILPLIFDALIIVFTQAMLAAKSRGDMWRVFQIFLFILFCAVINLIANVYASLAADVTFDSKKIWIAPILPYVVSVMPLFLAALAWIADTVGMTVIKKPTEEEMVYSRRDPVQWQKRELAKLKIRAMQVRVRELYGMIDSREKLLKAIQKKERKERYKKTPVADLHLQLQKLDGIIATVISEKADLATIALPENVLGVMAGNSTGLTVDNMTQPAANTGPIEASRNGKNVSLQNGTSPTPSQTSIPGADDTHGGASDQSSKNGNQAALDLASLNLSPDVLTVVQRYPDVYTAWLAVGLKSVTIPEIMAVTGLSKKRVQYQIGKQLKTTPRNDQRVYVTSVIDWLRTLPELTVSSAPSDQNGAAHQMEKDTDKVAQMPRITRKLSPEMLNQNGSSADQNSENVPLQDSKTVNEAYLHLVGKAGSDGMDKLAITLSAMRVKPEITDEELAGLLRLKRSASARFWRLQAVDILQKEIVERPAELANA